MSDLETISLTNCVRRRIVGAEIVAAATLALLIGCAGPQLAPESVSSPASVQAPESTPEIATVALDDDTTSLIAARLKESRGPQTGTPNHPAHSAAPVPASKNESKDAMYTCPMHPEIKENRPGDCSICGMNLVPI